MLCSQLLQSPPPPQNERGRGEGARYAGPGCKNGFIIGTLMVDMTCGRLRNVIRAS